MSGTFPSDPSSIEITLDSNQPVTVSLSVSGKRQSRVSAGHLWGIKLQYPIMTKAEFAPIFAFAAKQRGDSFQVTLTNFNAPKGAVTGSINASGITDAGSMTINIEGFVAGTADVFKAGDIIKTSSHSKVYMVAEDASAGANSDLLLEDGVSFLLLEDGVSHLMLESSGQASVQLVNPIVEEIVDNISVTYLNVPFTAYIDKDIITWKATAPSFSSYTVELIESIT